MPVQLIALSALMFIASCAAATFPKNAKPARMQFTFVHFKNENVVVTVDGKTVFDRVVPAASANWPNGFTAVAQIVLPPCADIVIKTKTQRMALQLCHAASTKSILVEGGPPLILVEKDHFQGDD